MKIHITKKQYEVLIKALETAGYIYGPMSDFVDDKYKKDVKDIDEVTHFLLEYAKDFNFEKNIASSEGKLYVKDGYSDFILDDISEYDDYQLVENLSNKLAWRDFHEKYSEKEIEKIKKEHGEYLGVPLYDFEKRYWDEFEKNDFRRLYIQEDKNGKIIHKNDAGIEVAKVIKTNE